MKRLLRSATTILITLIVFSSLLVSLPPEPAFAISGNGTEEDPYIITDIFELQAVGNDLDACYEFGNNIDASITETWNGGQGFNPIGNNDNPFTGSLNGNGFTIEGLYVNRPTSNLVGLFSCIGDWNSQSSTAVVENLKLSNIKITGWMDVGGLAGMTAPNSYIHLCWSSGNVTGDSAVGGLIGSSYSNLMVDIGSSCTVIGKYMAHPLYVPHGGEWVGGLIGRFSNTYPDEQPRLFGGYATGDVIAGSWFAGGLVGGCTGNVINSYATGDVSGETYVGGLAGAFGSEALEWGERLPALMANCYASGNVNSGGGLVGGHSSIGNRSAIFNCFYNTDSSGVNTGDTEIGKTTDEMKTKSTFTDADWDFEDVWDINSFTNNGYPFLRLNSVPYDLPVLVAYFTCPQYNAQVNESIPFNAYQSYSITGYQIESYEWNFGDGGTSSGWSEVYYDYASPGDYNVTLTITTGDGLTAAMTRSINVSDDSSWSFAVITDLHIGEGASGKDYDGPGWNDTGEGEVNIGSVWYLAQSVSYINSIREQNNIKFVVVLGDFTDSAEMSEFDKAIANLNGLDIPWVPIIGNHDIWPYTRIDEAPEVGQDDSGTDIFFYNKFQSQYDLLSGVLDNWVKEDVTDNRVWNDQVNPEHYSYFQNFAFDYNGYHFIGLDFSARDNAPLWWQGVFPEGDLFNFEGGTWDWFTNHLQQYIDENPESEENIILLSHHPFNSGSVSIMGFSQGELYTMDSFLKDYKTNVFAEFAGHTHQNKVSSWPLLEGDWSLTPTMKVVETDSNNDARIIRLVKVLPDNQVDYSKLLSSKHTWFITRCPVDLLVTDPDGLTTGKDINEIPGAVYAEVHLDEDGSLDDLIGIPVTKLGDYQINVIPEPGANPGDTYSLEVSTLEDTSGFVSVMLADNITIQNIPPEPYTFHSVEKQIVQITYTGETSGTNNSAVNLSTLCVDENGAPISGKEIVFGIGIQSVKALTDENGIANTMLILEQEPGTYYSVDAGFAGDEYYLPADVMSPFSIIQGNEPPTIHSVTASPNRLWPPNHRPVNVTFSIEATDPDGPQDIVRITYSVADEYGVYNVAETDMPVNGIISLISERNGNDKNGRVYTITVTVYDAGGLSVSDHVTIIVPHDQGKK